MAENGESKRPVPPSPEQYRKLQQEAEQLRALPASEDSNQARHKRQVQGGMQAYVRYTGIGMQFVLTMLLPMGAGWLLDGWLNTTPWLMVSGAGLGALMGMVFVVRTVFRMEAKSEANEKARDQSRDAEGKS